MRTPASSLSWVAALSSAAFAVWLWRPVAGVPLPATDLGAPATSGALVAYPGLGDLADTLGWYNPFHLDRQPPGIRPGTTEPVPEAAGETETPPDRPEPSLAGIVGGPPWAALVEGLPGAERGVLMFLGDEAHGVTLRAIKGDSVELTGYDTTWTLTLKRPWT